MLDRPEVEVLLTLAEELHFGRTAARLRLTTGQVSRILQRLERRIGAKLFTRTSRRVEPTGIGARLAEDLRPLVAEMEAAEQRAVNAGRGITGDLRVGFVGAVAGQVLLNAVARFSGRHPDCQVHIHEAQIHDACERVFAGGLDVLITALPVHELAVGPVLITEPLLLAVADDHPITRMSTVTREVFAAYPVIHPRGLPEATLRHRVPERTPAGNPVREGPVAETFSEILALVAAGKGIFPVGEHAARFYPRPGVAYLPIADAPDLHWAPVWLESAETSRIREFVRCAAEVSGND